MSNARWVALPTGIIRRWAGMWRLRPVLYLFILGMKELAAVGPGSLLLGMRSLIRESGRRIISLRGNRLFFWAMRRRSGIFWRCGSWRGRMRGSGGPCCFPRLITGRSSRRITRGGSWRRCARRRGITGVGSLGRAVGAEGASGCGVLPGGVYTFGGTVAEVVEAEGG